MTGMQRTAIAIATAAFIGTVSAAPARSAPHGDGVPPNIRYYEPVAMMSSSAAANQAARPADATTMDLSFHTLGRDFDLKLEAHDPFAQGATVRWVDDAGEVEEPAPAGVFYRGRVEGDPDSWARITVRGDALGGVVLTGDEMYFLEPAERFFGAEAAAATLAYRLSDTDLDSLTIFCGTPAQAAGSPATQKRGAGARRLLRELLDEKAVTAAAAGGLLQADLGVVADYEYFNRHGAASSTDLAEIVNSVDGIYQSELGVTVKILNTIVFTSINDPFSSTTTPLTLLGEIASYRDANDNSSSQPLWGTDLTHLFTARDLSGSVIGIAYLDSLCESSGSVGVDQDWTTSLNLLTLLMAHEMGHNFGAPHDNQTGSPCSSEPGTYIMNPSIGANLQPRFSPCSKSQISPVVSAAGCIDPAGPPPTPTNTPPPTSTPTRTHTPTPPALDAVFVSQTVPSSVSAGQQYSVTVTMRNAGTTTWTAAAAFRLGAVNPYDNANWGMNRVGLAGNESIAPGAQKSFTWTVTAPPTAGTYNFQWRMVQDGMAWFGGLSSNVAVAVSPATGPDAAFVSQTVPASMTAGQTYSVSVTMRNSGGTTWTAASLYRLGAINPYDNVTWGMNRVGLGANVAPGQQYTFTWNVTAPAAGIYNFQWRMVQEGLTWFGTASNNVVVAVNPGPPNAVFVAQSVPATMPAGQLVSVSVTMRNTGGTTWTAAALYRLGAINPHDNSNWGMNRVELGSGDSIAPNQQKTFTWTVRASATPGTYNFQWRMVQEGVTWFGGSSPNVVVTVQ